MKKYFWILILGLLLSNVFASPSNSISIPNTATSGTTISSSNYNENNNEIQNKFNAHSHTDITQLGTITTGTWSGNTIGKTYGGTGNSYGIGLPSGAVFFMVSGSCPSGSTDVSATYSNKFVRINATQGSTGGADTDSITLTTNELPAHTHNFTIAGDYASATGVASRGDALAEPTAVATTSTGSGNAFSVDTVPSYVTMKACQVN